MQETTLQSIAEDFTPEYREFISSGYTDALAAKLGDDYELTEVEKVIVRNGFDLYLHFVLPSNELLQFYVEEGIEQNKAQNITNTFITDLPSELTAQHDEVITELRTPPPQETTPVSPVRTMANDMETAREGQTYASSQDALLRKQTLSDPDQARWQQTN